MQKLHDPDQIARWLEEGTIRAYFDTPDLPFEVWQYEKGELLSTPERPTSALLFIIRGSVQIYGVRDNGNLLPVNQSEGPTLIGDIEFCCKTRPVFFARAQTPVLCAALPFSGCRAQLDRDVRFLHLLLDSCLTKLILSAHVDPACTTVEERVLRYLRDGCACHELHSVEAAVLQLRCSRRQLQRALKKLCGEGKLEKTGKGRYRLSDAEREKPGPD